MMRLGRNRGRYEGETIAIAEVQRDILAEAHRQGWTLTMLTAAPGIELPALVRPPCVPTAWAPRLYLSAGIHGDEPAGPLAILRLLHLDIFPKHAWLWCCPCLNPTGFQRNSRESAEGIDLNRDYRHLRSPEIRAHEAWLSRQPAFDLALCLHEDWESEGFYVYELNPDLRPSLAPAMIDEVRRVCPIDESPLIEGREARSGIICPSLDPASRPEWPEAFYLLQNKTRLCYTLEAPSDYALETRVSALVAGSCCAIRLATQAAPVAPPSDRAAQPPP